MSHSVVTNYSCISPAYYASIKEYHRKNGTWSEKEEFQEEIISEKKEAKEATAVQANSTPNGRNIISLPLNHQGSPRELWNAKNPSSPSLLFSSTNENSLPHRVRQKLQTEAYSCYKNMEFTDLFFRNVFSVSPVPIGTMKSYIYHPHENFQDNASWIPSQNAVYFGKVDPKAFTSFAANQDIVIHEFGHSVTQYSANFDYSFQSGALDESMSDIFAIMAKHYQRQALAPLGGWTIAEGLIYREKGDECFGTALRSLRNPGSAHINHPLLPDDHQVKHMNSYVHKPNTQEGDCGGVHTNSGIPNRAFYEASIGILGHIWERSGLIWQTALLKAEHDETFATFAGLTMRAAKELKFHEGVQNIVGQAWRYVGVDPVDWNAYLANVQAKIQAIKVQEPNYTSISKPQPEELTIAERIFTVTGIGVLIFPSFIYSLIKGKPPTWGLDLYDRSQENASIFSPIR